MMGKISFFLELQISQSPRGIFINQSKYALESLKKYGFESCNPVDTLMVEKSKLDEDKEGKAVDLSHYRGMIGTLLYLTASRHDLQFAICMCAQYQARPIEKHDSSVSLIAFADADHAGCQDTRRSTSGSVQFLGERTMDTTIEQQAAIDEALVPHAQRLRIRRSNFHFLSDIKSKESTLQLVYDVLRICPFFKAFLPWRSFAAIINKCLTGKSSGYDSLRLSQAQILWGLYHKRNVDYAYLMWEDFIYQVKHKNHKKSNEMYYPRFMKVIIHHFMSKDPSILRRNKVNWHYVKDDYMFSTIKLYYAIAIGAAPPKPKASARRTKSSSDTSITPPIAAASPRLIASAKGKQTAKASKAKSLSALSEVAMTEAQQLKLVTKRSMQQMHISQASGSGTDEGTGADNEGKDGDDDEEDKGDDGEEGDGDDDDDQEVERADDKDDEEEGGDDDQEFDDDEYAEETKDEESFDPIPKPLKTVTMKAMPQNSSVSSQFVTSMLNPTLDVGMESIFETTSQMDVPTPTSVAPLPMTAPTMTPSTISTKHNNPKAEVLIQSSHSSKTSYAVAANLSEIELKKILIEKMEGNKSIQISNEQRNLYKAFIEAYESNKIILDTYGETVTLKRRRDDDADKDEEPSAGPDRGSKRRRKGKKPESASAPTETATRSAGSIQPWISELAKQTDSRSSFNELVDTPLDFSNFLINRLKYPHNLLKPLPLIPNNRGRHVIPFEHFINNDLEYLLGGDSSRKYTTSITKTKATYYGHIKWIEDLVSRPMWIEEPIGYDKHALWGVSH
nr:hypothetical protein [Tanacetum cinerariifolium]